MQSFWSEYLKNLRVENIEALPFSFLDVIAKINNWLELNTMLMDNTK
jgi:hypothetical protein